MQLKSSNRKARLEDVLSYGDANHIIVSIAKNLHYSDIVSLTLTSKSIRHAVYSRLSLDKHTALLNRLACEKGSKHECWCCGIEICDVRFHRAL